MKKLVTARRIVINNPLLFRCGKLVCRGAVWPPGAASVKDGTTRRKIELDRL